MPESGVFGVPGVDGWLFLGLAAASFVTNLLGTVAGTAGGLALLAIMALVFPPAVLVPVHTVIQLGSGSSRAVLMRRYILRGTLIPFAVGSALGAALGARIFITLPSAVLQASIGVLILVLVWLPRIARIGPETGRFAALGFAATLLGIFVSATGTLVAPFVAAASPDRRNHTATLSALMAMVHIMKLLAFGFVGFAVTQYVPLMAAMIVAAVLGNWAGVRALDHMPERLFRIVFQILVTGLALRLLWVGGVEIGLW